MKVIFDPNIDALTVISSDAPVVDGDKDKPGVILEYDVGRSLVSIEILDASQQVEISSRIGYQAPQMSV